MMKMILGQDLTPEQKSMLKFNGMSDPKWVRDHGFIFENGKPCKREGWSFPVMCPSKLSFQRIAEWNKENPDSVGPCLKRKLTSTKVGHAVGPTIRRSSER